MAKPTPVPTIEQLTRMLPEPTSEELDAVRSSPLIPRPKAACVTVARLHDAVRRHDWTRGELQHIDGADHAPACPYCQMMRDAAEKQLDLPLIPLPPALEK